MTHGVMESMLFSPSLAPKISFISEEKTHFRFQGLEAYWQQENPDTQILSAQFQGITEYYHTQLRQDYLRILAAEWACGVILKCLKRKK